MRGKLAVAAAAVALSIGTFAPAALASGANAGGVNSGGVNSGGVNAGGGSASTPVASTSCVRFGSWSNKVGHYKIWGAVWTSLNFSSSCYVTYEVTYVNSATGVLEGRGIGQLMNSTLSQTIDADFLANGTPYTVTLTITDASGVVQVQQSENVTTPPMKAGV